MLKWRLRNILMPPNPHRQELMAVHGVMAAVRVDPEEHLASAAAADMVQALAQMKSPSDYPPGLNR